MIRPRGAAVRLAAVSLPLLALGCATFSELPPREVGLEPHPHGSLAVEVSEWSYHARPSGAHDRVREPLHTDAVRAAMAESQWFAPVGLGMAAADFQARVSVRRYQSFPYGVVLSALTAFLIPTRVERQVAVNMTLRGASLPARCAVRGSYRVWYQTFAPALGRRPRAFEADLVRRLTLVCLDELLEALPRPEPGH